MTAQEVAIRDQLRACHADPLKTIKTLEALTHRLWVKNHQFIDAFAAADGPKELIRLINAADNDADRPVRITVYLHQDANGPASVTDRWTRVIRGLAAECLARWLQSRHASSRNYWSSEMLKTSLEMLQEGDSDVGQYGGAVLCSVLCSDPTLRQECLNTDMMAALKHSICRLIGKTVKTTPIHDSLFASVRWRLATWRVIVTLINAICVHPRVADKHDCSKLEKSAQDCHLIFADGNLVDALFRYELLSIN
jgi:hypothetical protein